MILPKHVLPAFSSLEKKYLYPKNTMSHVTAARTYLDISDNDSFPSLFLSNKSSCKKSKLHVGTINHVKKEICTAVMTNLISMKQKLEGLLSYVQTDAATPNNVASVCTGLKVCVTTPNNTQQHPTNNNLSLVFISFHCIF